MSSLGSPGGLGQESQVDVRLKIVPSNHVFQRHSNIEPSLALGPDCPAWYPKERHALHVSLCKPTIASSMAWGSWINKRCAARQIPGESVVCVCNTTYCDTVTRRTPQQDTFISYTSSQDGLRFKKTTGPLLSSQNTEPRDVVNHRIISNNRWIDEFQSRDYDTDGSQVTLTLDPTTRYQTVEGFGGAITDAAGINWMSLPQTLQQFLVDAYFSASGIEYSMTRVPVGGCDFSTRPYAYNELPVNDTTLSNYSLTYEDYHYKLPMIKAAMNSSSKPLHVIATVWSPPPWMKSNGGFSGYSRLKPEYYQTYADYYYKFIEQYAAEGVAIWGITTTNEPTNGVIPINYFNSLGWTADSLGKWIVHHLGPKIRNSTFSNVKIIAGDDQRATLPYWISRMLVDEPKALDYIDGVAVHFYTDFITPATVLTEVMKGIPQKFLLATEACEGNFPWQRHKVQLGSWDRAYDYIHDIITDLNHNAVGWLDWNLCLNSVGGPNWAKNYVDSAIIVVPEKNLFLKQPMFYALGHFSKFIPRGSQRILVKESRFIFSSGLEYVAFLTPRGTLVIVLYNKGASRTVNLYLGNKVAPVRADAKSVITVEIPFTDT